MKKKLKKKTLLIGRGTIAVNCLRILKKLDQLPEVIVCDPEDIGIDTWTKSLLLYARKLNYELDKNLFVTRKVNSPKFLASLQKLNLNVDIIFSLQPKTIFRKDFIVLAKDYVVNLHFAPLPLLRGVATSPWAILDGLKTMGVTLHLIEDEGIDNGPIIAQVKFPISKAVTSRELYDKNIFEGTKLFRKEVRNILSKQISLTPQSESTATYHPLGELDFKKTEVNLNQNFSEVDKFIRSRIFPPFQYPYFFYKGNKVVIKKIKVVSTSKKNKEKIIRTGNNFIINLGIKSIVIQSYKIVK